MGMNGEWMFLNGRQWMDGTKQTDGDGCQTEWQWTLNKTKRNFRRTKQNYCRTEWIYDRMKWNCRLTKLNYCQTEWNYRQMELGRTSEGNMMKKRRTSNKSWTNVICDIKWTSIALTHDVTASDYGGIATRALHFYQVTKPRSGEWCILERFFLSLFLSLSLSLSLSLFFSLSRKDSLSVCVCVSLSLFLSFFLSLSLFLSLSQRHVLSLVQRPPPWRPL